MCVSEMDEKNAVVTVEQSSGTTFRLVNRRVRKTMMALLPHQLAVCQRRLSLC